MQSKLRARVSKSVFASVGETRAYPRGCSSSARRCSTPAGVPSRARAKSRGSPLLLFLPLSPFLSVFSFFFFFLQRNPAYACVGDYADNYRRSAAGTKFTYAAFTALASRKRVQYLDMEDRRSSSRGRCLRGRCDDEGYTQLHDVNQGDPGLLISWRSRRSLQKSVSRLISLSRRVSIGCRRAIAISNAFRCFIVYLLLY